MHVQVINITEGPRESSCFINVQCNYRQDFRKCFKYICRRICYESKSVIIHGSVDLCGDDGDCFLWVQVLS